ncbi:T9SS type A sorting domain-containing protein [Aestuariivivens insulae]|uniref:T9SS type A sorting domain-containing protein n=1 Tax=Aestuariivivens insulae TaxID=1621988 RepID=UPI001F58E63E|nr:T9SS type A sorting domain-containing protein [Aestuariivivens insulae]
MKTRLCLFVALLFATYMLSAQCPAAGYTCIPDANFEQALIDLGHDSGSPDGRVLTSNINGITSLSINNKSIADLTGIEDFAALQTFNCSFNSFSTLMLPNGDNLLELICQGPSITNVDVVSAHPALTKIDIKYGNVSSLNVDANVNLQYLDVYDNSISNLSLANNTALTFLDCYRNGLTSLDLSNNALLQTLNCKDNNLSMLDLTNNTSLVTLNCDSCVNMTNLTLPDTTSLITIDCVNCDSLTSLDVSNNENLYSLNIPSSGLQNTLNLANNNLLFYLDCSNNDLSGLTLPDPSNLSEIYCNNNMIPSLNLGGCTGLTYMECQYNSLISLDVSSCSLLQELYCHHNSVMTSITFNNPVLKYLYCNNSPMLTTLNNTLSLTGLIDFGLWNCDLTTLDLTNSSVLVYVEPGNNTSLSTLTLPSNKTALESLWAYNMDLSSLNYNEYTALVNLDIGINQFTEADVSMLPNLYQFYCNQNQLTTLNLKNGNNSNLMWMWADDNPSLNCIQVDDVTYANNKTIADDWRINGSEYYSTDCTLGIDDFYPSNISIYPNPTKHSLFIEPFANTEYNLLNIQGQEMLKGHLTSGINEIDVSSIAKGVYIMNLQSSQGKITKKLIKQ